MADVMHIKDTKTREVFKVNPTCNTVYVETRDGVRVRLHPIVIKTMVCKGEVFRGHSILGDRDMVKL